MDETLYGLKSFQNWPKQAISYKKYGSLALKTNTIICLELTSNYNISHNLYSQMKKPS